MPYIYMMRCRNGSLYSGWTTDLVKRMQQHQNGRGAKYTRAFGGETLAYAETLPDKSAALKREAAIKKLSKSEKEALAEGFSADAFVILREATPTDTAQIAAIYSHYITNTTATFYYEPLSAETFEKQIRQTKRILPYIVAQTLTGEVLGYACAHLWRYTTGGYAWDAETTIYLKPGLSGIGLGGMLYNALLALLAAQGYWNAYGVLADPNPTSEVFHTKFGFVCEGRQARSGYKLGGWQGVSYWVLRLRQGEENPGAYPRAIQKKDYKNVLSKARSGLRWQQIVAELPPDEES